MPPVLYAVGFPSSVGKEAKTTIYKSSSGCFSKEKSDEFLEEVQAIKFKLLYNAQKTLERFTNRMTMKVGSLHVLEFSQVSTVLSSRIYFRNGRVLKFDSKNDLLVVEPNGNNLYPVAYD